jgi:hypothetical protein
LRGLAVATIAVAPVLMLSVPAHGEDILGAIDPPSTDPTTTTTTVPEPAPLEGTPTTPPTEVTTPSTEVTTPTTEAPTTDTTTPPDTTTTPSTEATTPTTVPAVAPVVPPSSGPPRSGSTGSTRGGAPANDTATTDTKDAPLVLLTVGSPQDSPLAGIGDGGVQAVASLFTRPLGTAKETVTAVAQGTLSAAFGGDISPVSTDNTWGGLGSAGPRFLPWIVLLAMAWIVRTVIGSILADRTAGPRRRRWTLL